MATLEVHDGRGRVEYVSIAQEGTSLIGSDPKCDVVLAGPDVRPVHARLRWKRGRLKVEATPDAQAIDVNGERVVLARLRQGDEIRIGARRIFLLNLGQGAADAEPTRVQDRPAAAPPEAADWLRDIEVAPPSVEEDRPAPRAASRPSETPPAPLPRKGFSRATLAAGAASATIEASPKPTRVPRLIRSLRNLLGGDAAPGQERILSSPVVLGLAASIAMLVLLSLSLRGTIARRAADNQFKRALETFQDGDYLNATRQFAAFLERAPDDPRAGRARVLSALAGVRQFAAGSAPAWGEALSAAREMVRGVGDLPAFDDARADLAETLLGVTEGLADRAARASDAALLAEAEAALALARRTAGKGADNLEAKSRAPAKLDAARAAVRKGITRRDALAAMDRALQAGSAAAIYEARDRLVAQYRDLAADTAVVERLTRGNDLLRQAVTFDPSVLPAETEPRPEPLGPPTTLVVRQVREGRPDPASPAVFALAEGFAFGLSESDGAPLWQVPVGLSSPFAPVPVGGDRPSVLVVDARHHDLLRLDARDGRLLWRQELGEPIADPPLVLGNDLYTALPSGQVLRIDLANGERRGAFDCKRPLARAPVADELGRHLYLAADEAVLFVLDRDPPGCPNVEYIGHEAGSVPCPAARLGRYLVLPVNEGLDEGDLRVFLLEQDGAKLRPIQRLPVAGWTWSTPPSAGSVLWSAGDRGGLTAYAVGAETERQPFQRLARVGPDARPSGPAFARARSDRELWLASGRTARFDLSPERGEVRAAWTFVDAGAALAPIQYAGRYAVLSGQPADGPGVAVWALDPADGSLAWSTILGRPWPVAPAATPDGLATLGLTGAPLPISRSQLSEGGFVELNPPAPGSFRLPIGGTARLSAIGDLRVVLPTPGSDTLRVARGDGPLQEVGLPAPLAAPPVPWGGGLLAAGRDGLVYLIDPETGAPTADPFVPPFDRTRPNRWLAPAILSGDAVALADDLGRLRRIVHRSEPRSRLVAEGDPVELGSPPAAPPLALASAVLLVTEDGNIRSLSARDLTPLGAWPLPGRLAVGPAPAGDHAIVADGTGQVRAFGPDGQLAWSAELGDTPAGPPALSADAAWLLDRAGVLHGFALPDGAPMGRYPLAILPAGGPLPVEGGLAIRSAPGILQPFTPPSEGAPQETPP